MAPQHGMLSHLRFHRAGPSSPGSDQASLSTLNAHPSPLRSAAGHDGPSPSDGQAPVAGSSSSPPVLPPIARVASTEIDFNLNDAIPTQPDAGPFGASQSLHDAESSFIGGVTLRNFRRHVEAQTGTEGLENYSTSSTSQRPKSTSAGSISPTRTLSRLITRSQSKLASSFNSPTASHPSSAASKTRPPISLTSNELSPSSSSANATPIEPQKGKRSLPFLKNPMLLMRRRRANQDAQNKHSISTDTRMDESVYDPRIKGTRVHDFSAPRRKSNVPTTNMPAAISTPHVNVVAGARARDGHKTKSMESIPGSERPQPSDASVLTLPESARTTSHAIEQSSSISSVGTKSSRQEKPAPGEEDALAPPLLSVEEAVSSLQTTPSKIAGINEDVDAASRPLGSSRAARSRSVSLSSIPRHMKSTSSRFSFEVIGAGKQEKILEERHRQREQNRKSAAGKSARDSMYDDFDEDAFDYDAMMQDDGLEERIPGVNVDYDEDQFIGDDDYPGGGVVTDMEQDLEQDGSAGLAFPRGFDAGSSLQDPQIGGLPADCSGRVDSFADSEDSSPELQHGASLRKSLDSSASGLGIQAAPMSGPPHGTDVNASGRPAVMPPRYGEDDLYFDGGMTGFEGEFLEDLAAEPEGDGVPFDESIFDIEDTDQFGRPLPGAFALAQSLRRAVKDASTDADAYRESRVPEITALSSALARAALEAEAQQSEPREDGGSWDAPAPAHENQDHAFAAMAALPGEYLDPDDAYYDDYGYVDNGLDDYELDDDAIIAEANASALANDADGWYGQEFGFYSAPVANHGAQNANLESYGGFFGPKGLDGISGTTNGGMVSREPNLTPITERSEYSNRNSLMSLGIPPLNAGTPTMQSAGLAQLAMMTDRGEDMNISALLRLRSRAWGDSQASLVSSQEGSARSEWGDGPGPCSPRGSNLAHYPGASNAGQGRKNSAFSVVSREGEARSLSGSPTLTLAIPARTGLTSFGAGAAAVEASANASPGDGAGARAHASDGHHEGPGSAVSRSSSSLSSPAAGYSFEGHQRKKGSADSISYRIEKESGEARWVMERRRTGEFGQVEIVEREVVEGGRI